MRMLSAHAFVTLPKLDADATASLIRKLCAQPDAHTHVPAGAVETFDAMKAAGLALEAATSAEDVAPRGGAVGKAHVDVLRAWAYLEQWLGAFAALDDGDDPRVPTAKTLYAELFGQGLGFANARVEAEWPRSERKIRAVAHAHHAATFDALGGAVFWTRVLAAHAAEGAAAHVTTATPAAPPAADLQARLLEAQDAMREYVAHVIGTVRRSSEASQARADALLRPLATWTPAAATASPGAPPAAPPTPAPGGAP